MFHKISVGSHTEVAEARLQFFVQKVGEEMKRSCMHGFLFYVTFRADSAQTAAGVYAWHARLYALVSRLCSTEKLLEEGEDRLRVCSRVSAEVS